MYTDGLTLTRIRNYLFHEKCSNEIILQYDKMLNIKITNDISIISNLKSYYYGMKNK